MDGLNEQKHEDPAPREEGRMIYVDTPMDQTGVSITVPAMGTLPATTYVEENGVIAFPIEARAHANVANGLFRAEDKATATLRERARLIDQQRNVGNRLESAIRDAASGKADVAQAVAATVMGIIPDVMRQMREDMKAEMRAEIRKELEGATAPIGDKSSAASETKDDSKNKK